jgi:hypothetical protein
MVRALPGRLGVLLALIASLVACGRPTPESNRTQTVESPRQEASMSDTEAGWKRLADGTATCSELQGRYRDGNGLEGWTTVEFTNARVTVRRTSRGPEETWDGTLAEVECRHLARSVLDGRLWEVRSQRTTGVPDETRPSIQFGLGGEAGFTVQVWANEIDSLPQFAAVQKVILGITARVSNGKVRF